MKYIYRTILILFIAGSPKGNVWGQIDAQYTQFYANSLYLSPSFAGSTESSRAFMIGRLQWPGISGVRRSGTASIDHYFYKYNSGIGLIVNQDYLPGPQLSSLNIALQYAYHIKISDEITLSPGLQIGVGRRTIGYNKLTFNDQYSDLNGYNTDMNTGENFSKDRVNFYPDIAAGGLLLAPQAWIGISTAHMNRPVESYTGDQRNKIAMKTSIHAGLKFYFIDDGGDEEKEKSISPTLQYKAQGKWDQLDVGIYGRYNFIVVGVWYRGIPVKVYKPERTNNDALNFLLGFVYDKFNIGYSYDLTISRLTNKSGGSHELSITYQWPKPKRRLKAKRVVCPKF